MVSPGTPTILLKTGEEPERCKFVKGKYCWPVKKAQTLSTTFVKIEKSLSCLEETRTISPRTFFFLKWFTIMHEPAENVGSIDTERCFTGKIKNCRISVTTEQSKTQNEIIEKIRLLSWFFISKESSYKSVFFICNRIPHYKHITQSTFYSTEDEYSRRNTHFCMSKKNSSFLQSWMTF